MKQIDRTITTDAPAEKVWAFMSDFTNTEQWDPPTVSTTLIGGDGGVGSVYGNVSHLLGRDVTIHYTVLEFEPERFIELRGVTNAMRMIDTMEVTGTPFGSQLRYVARFYPQGAARLAEPLLPLGLRRLGDRAEAQISQCLSQL